MLRDENWFYICTHFLNILSTIFPMIIKKIPHLFYNQQYVFWVFVFCENIQSEISKLTLVYIYHWPQASKLWNDKRLQNTIMHTTDVANLLIEKNRHGYRLMTQNQHMHKKTYSAIAIIQFHFWSLKTTIFKYKRIRFRIFSTFQTKRYIW